MLYTHGFSKGTTISTQSQRTYLTAPANRILVVVNNGLNMCWGGRAREWDQMSHTLLMATIICSEIPSPLKQFLELQGILTYCFSLILLCTCREMDNSRQHGSSVLHGMGLQYVSYDCHDTEGGKSVLIQVGKLRWPGIKISLIEGICSFSCELFHPFSNLLSCNKSSTSGISLLLYPFSKCRSCLLHFTLLTLSCVILASPTQQVRAYVLPFITDCHFTNGYETLQLL